MTLGGAGLLLVVFEAWLSTRREATSDGDDGR